MPTVNVLRPGDTSKPDPFTIAIVANPALEQPWKSGAFAADDIASDEPAFDQCAAYIDDALFGNLPDQRERLLADPAIEPYVRVVTLFAPGLPAVAANALVGEHPLSLLLVARRATFRPFLARFGLDADVAYAVSLSASHARASAWGTSDDDAGPGAPFELDGATLHHRHRSLIPGAVAIHASAHSLTALHEFGHALSSYSNGYLTDLYVDSGPALNNKLGRPIPPDFGTYEAASTASDPTRDGLGYPAGWASYHPEPIDPALPAVMDDYWMAADGLPEHCRHDRLTRQFLRDRLRAKITR